MNKFDQRLLALEASAGSGKTYQLVVRYISLLLKGNFVNEILAITFTRAAASEMKARVISFLLLLTSKEESEEKETLIALLKEHGVTEDLLDKNLEAKYEEFVSTSANIETIDAFMYKIFRKFIFYTDINENVDISNGYDAKTMSKLFFKESSNSNMEDYIELGALLGKNRLFPSEDSFAKQSSIFEFLEYLYEKNIDIASMIDDDLPKKEEELKEIEENIYSIYDKFIHELKAGGYEPNKSFARDITTILNSTWFEKDIDTPYKFYKKYYTTEIATKLQNMQEQATRYCKGRDNIVFIRLNKIYKSYKILRSNYIGENRELSFSDINIEVFNLLKNHIDKDFLYFRLDNKISHILIDEFQDTNKMQYETMEPLLEEIRSALVNKSFFFVGDKKQSIYGFRGGTYKIFDYAKNKNMMHVEVLEKNFRSEKRVVDFVNETFEKLYKGDISYKHQIANKSGEDSEVKIDVVSKDEDYKNVVLDNVLSRVKELLSLGIHPKDIAIITPTNNLNSEISQYLEKENIRTFLKENRLLIEYEPIKLAIDILRYSYLKYMLENNIFNVDNPKVSIESDIYLYKLEIDSYGFNINEYQIDFDDSLKSIFLKIFKKHSTWDDNISKFMRLLDNYRDVESLLFNLNKLKDEIENNSGDGVNIMTIHKSKGLEFAHVIFASQSKVKQNRERYICELNENLEIENIIIKRDEAYLKKINHEAIERDNEERDKEGINFLYVALTRAKKSLYITIVEGGPYDKEFKSEGIGSLIGRIREDATELLEKKDVILPKYGKQELAITKEEDSHDFDLNNIEYGNMFHEILENMDNFKINDNLKRYIYNNYGTFIDNEDILYQDVKSTISNPAFQNLLKGKEIYQEISFVGKDGSLKRCDLMLVDENECFIVDFKTSSNKDYEDEYRKQIEEYCSFAKQRFAHKKVSGYLYKVGKKNEIMEVYTK